MAALQAQRPVLGDAVVEAALAPLRAHLAALAAPVQELRLVTLLVLDVAGSTQLARHLDPEDISAVMDGALAHYAQQVRQHGGQVLQFAGDNLMAGFGLDGAREDDAERAVHCALALVAASREQAREVLAQHGQAGFAVRVGVHTGPVLRSAERSGAVRGNTPALAVCMEQTAPVGGVQISQDTWRHVQGRFQVQAAPAQAVHGRDAPLGCYVVQAALPAGQAGAARGVDGVATPLLGRRAELEALLATLADVRADGLPRGLTLLAEAGLGKTRLVHELQQHIDAQGGLPCLRGRCLPSGRGQPYKLLREMIAGWLGLADSSDGGAAYPRLQAALASLLPAEQQARVPLLARLIGLQDPAGATPSGPAAPDPRQLRDRGLAVFQAMLAGLAARAGSPVLLLADDLHWADEASLDMLPALLAGPAPLLMVASARPELLERRPDWAASEPTPPDPAPLPAQPLPPPRHRRLLLQPLADDDANRLAAALLQRVPAPPPALTGLLVDQAGGNPYYMEELLKVLIDQGVVSPGAGAAGPWQVDIARLGGVQVPTTLAGVLQARLALLPGAERQALQQAAIVGSVFWDQALARLSADAPAALPALRERALVRAQASSAFEGCTCDSFQHHLLHQVVYDTVPPARRRAGHAQVARWLAERLAGGAGEHLATTAHHYLAADEPAAAALWLARAADYAWQRFDNRSALAQVQQALALLDGLDAQSLPELADCGGPVGLRWQLLLLGQRVADLTGERVLQARWVQAQEALLATPQAQPGWAARASYSRAVLSLRHDQHALAIEAGLRTLALAQTAGDASCGAEVCNVLVVASRLLGQPAGARQHARTGIELARQAGLAAIQLRLQANLGLVDFEAGDYHAARQALAAATALARQQPESALILGLLLCNLAGCEIELGNYDAASQWAEQAIAEGRAVGDHSAAAVAAQNLAEARLAQGRLEEALQHAHEAVQGSTAMGNRIYAGNAWLAVAEIELALGRADAAAQACGQAEALHAEVHHAPGLLEAALRRAAVALAQGRRADVLPLLEPQLPQVLAQLQAGSAPLRWPWQCHELLAALGDERAGTWLQHTQGLLQALAARLPDDEARAQYLARQAVARAVAALGEGGGPPARQAAAG